MIEGNPNQTKWTDTGTSFITEGKCALQVASQPNLHFVGLWRKLEHLEQTFQFISVILCPFGYISFWTLDSLLLGQQWQLLLIEIHKVKNSIIRRKYVIDIQ